MEWVSMALCRCRCRCDGLYIAAAFWNSVPCQLRKAASTNDFKNLYKRIYFKYCMIRLYLCASVLVFAIPFLNTLSEHDAGEGHFVAYKATLYE